MIQPDPTDKCHIRTVYKLRCSLCFDLLVHIHPDFTVGTFLCAERIHVVFDIIVLVRFQIDTLRQ